MGLARTILATTACIMLASTVAAQAPRSSVDVAATAGVPEFRDPKTGQVWTPLNVGQGPLKNPAPNELAFDPLGQAVRLQGAVIQRPGLAITGWAPPSAGPSVPLVTIDNASLRAVAGKRWQVVLYVNNNSAGTMAPMIDCRFTNVGKLVEETRALLPAMGGGLRAGLTIHGPKTDLFVDRAHCRIVSP
ncbi:MAG: hypothetical protein IBJ17_00400 [Reyranella sp.]|nr:hypothetical protein [Reyranella sp.]